MKNTMDSRTSFTSEIVYDNHHHGTVFSVDEQENSTAVQQSNSDSNNVISIIVFVFFHLLLPVVGIIINIKLYNNVKNETHQEKGKIIQKVVKTYAIVQAIFWPCVIWGYGGLILIDLKLYSLDQACFIRYFKLTLRYVTKMLTTYVAFNSGIVAICRYLFIVQDQEVSRFGIKRIKRILIVASFAVPFIIVNLDEVFIPHGWFPLHEFYMTEEDRRLSHRSQLSSPSPTLMTDQHVCLFLDGISSNQTQNIEQSPLYTLTKYYVPAPVIYAMRMVFYILLSVIMSNIGEGLLYFRIFVHLKR